MSPSVIISLYTHRLSPRNVSCETGAATRAGVMCHAQLTTVESSDTSRFCCGTNHGQML